MVQLLLGTAFSPFVRLLTHLEYLIWCSLSWHGVCYIASVPTDASECRLTAGQCSQVWYLHTVNNLGNIRVIFGANIAVLEFYDSTDQKQKTVGLTKKKNFDEARVVM